MMMMMATRDTGDADVENGKGDEGSVYGAGASVTVAHRRPCGGISAPSHPAGHCLSFKRIGACAQTNQM